MGYLVRSSNYVLCSREVFSSVSKSVVSLHISRGAIFVPSISRTRDQVEPKPIISFRGEWSNNYFSQERTVNFSIYCFVNSIPLQIVTQSIVMHLLLFHALVMMMLNRA